MYRVRKGVKVAYSTRLSAAIHILVNVALAERAGQPVSSAGIAKSLAANPSQVRQIMVKLRKGGLIRTSQGSARSTLARSAKDITMLDVYRAIEGEAPLLHLSTAVNPECGTGQNVQAAIGKRFDQVQTCAEREMGGITLDDIVRDYLGSMGSYPGWDDPYSTGACLA